MLRSSIDVSWNLAALTLLAVELMFAIAWDGLVKLLEADELDGIAILTPNLMDEWKEILKKINHEWKLLFGRCWVINECIFFGNFWNEWIVTK